MATKSHSDHREPPVWRWLSRVADLMQVGKYIVFVVVALVATGAGLFSIFANVPLPTGMLLFAAGIALITLVLAVAARSRLGDNPAASSTTAASRGRVPEEKGSPPPSAGGIDRVDLRPEVWNCDTRRYERLGDDSLSDPEVADRLAEKLLEGEALLKRTSQLLMDVGHSLVAQLIRGPETTEQDMTAWEQAVAALLNGRVIERARVLADRPSSPDPLGVGHTLAALENPLWRRLDHRVATLTGIIKAMEGR